MSPQGPGSSQEPSVRGRKPYSSSYSPAERPIALSAPQTAGYLGKASAPGNTFCRSCSRPLGPGSREPRGCKLGRNNYLCQSLFLSRGQTKGTPPCSPPRGEVCGGNRETRTIVTGAPPRSFQPWGAGAEVGRGQEQWRRDRQKGKDRDSQKDQGRQDKPRGRISASTRSQERG